MEIGDWGRWGRRLLVVAVLLLGFGLRFHLLGAQSFWNDEGNSARLSERSLELIIEGTASDIHPPLYYLLLHGWRALAGDSEFALRAFSAFAGVLAVPAVIALGLLPGGKRPYLTALIAGLVTAVSPSLITYSQETRMYALLGLLAVLSTLFLAKFLVVSFQFSVFRGRAIGWGAAYVVCAAAGLYTHYFFPAVLLAQNLVFFVLLVRFRTWGEMARNNVVASAHDHTAPSRPYSPSPHPSSPHPVILSPKQLKVAHLVTFIILQLAILLLYLPWLPIFLQQFGADDLSGRGALMPFLREAFWWLAFGQTLPFVGWGLVVVLLVALFGLVNGRTRSLPPLILLITPVLMMYAAGTTGPEFFKFLIVAVPFLALLLGMGFSPQRRRLALNEVEVERRGNSDRENLRALRASAVPVFLLFLTLPLLWQSLDNLYHNPAYARADYRGMAQRILDEGHPNAAVILDAPNQWEVFTYYFPDESAVYPLPKGRSRPNPAEIDATLSEIVEKYGRIYAIFWGEAQRDPERLVERWLDEHAFKAVDEWVGDVRFVMYAVPSAPAETMETETNWQFGEAITLQGYTVGAETALPGDVVPVTLFWQTAVPLDKRYKVFLHLLDENGQVVAQRDSEPGGGLALTSTWPPGETIVDNHGLFLLPDLPSGTYTLTLGLYDIADPAARLPIQTETGVVDAAALTIVAVRGR